jgi:putative SOS response-associated peptidase YedK
VHQKLVGIQSSNEARRAGHVALTSTNAVVEPIHPKAMPVILTTDEERDVWMPPVPKSPAATKLGDPEGHGGHWQHRPKKVRSVLPSPSKTLAQDAS